MSKKPDKIAIWNEILHGLRGVFLDRSFYLELRDGSRIEKLGPNKVLIAVLSESALAECDGQNQLDIENAFTAFFRRKMTVSFIHDKKRLWQSILDDVSDVIDMGVYFSLQDKGYIDRIEEDKVVVAVFSQAIKEQCEKKYRFKIANATSDALDRKVEILFVHGAPRIFIKLPHRDKPEEVRLKMLHDAHGDIMSIVDNDALFRQVSLPLEKGGWGLNPKKLTNDCKDYGVIAVQEALAAVAAKPNVIKPAVYFDGGLKRGVFGEKLAKGADKLGIRHQGELLADRVSERAPE